jgi:hypothetical protein
LPKLAPRCQSKQKAFLLKVDRRTPPIIPTEVFGFFQITSIALGGAALLDAQSWFSGESTLDAGFFSQGNTFGGLLVQSLCHGGGAALVAKAQNFEGARGVALSGADHVPNFDFSGCFGRLAIDLYATFANFVRGQRPGLVKPGGPQPFVDSYFVHKVLFWAETSTQTLFL